MHTMLTDHYPFNGEGINYFKAMEDTLEQLIRQHRFKDASGRPQTTLGLSATGGKRKTIG